MNKDMSGTRLGQYELRDRLGRGGMAEVYKAYQPGMDRFVAVKLLLGHLADDENFIERFRREAQAVGRLRHSNIVNVFDFGIQDDIYFMVMEFLRGGNLKERLNKAGRLPLYAALRFTGQLADALAYAHHAGMIHRDLKPANVMFNNDEDDDAILTDFGIARILTESGLTNSGMMVGTPAYMSPEAGHGLPADERADIYALGIILYEMVTGEVPYSADTPLAIVMKHINAPLPSLAPYQLPENVELLITRAMAKNPAERFQTAADMKAEIDKVLPSIDKDAIAALPTAQAAQPVGRTDRADSLTQIPPVSADAAPQPTVNEPTPPDATNAIPAATQPPTRENSPTPDGIPAPKASEGDTADTGKPLPSEFPFPRYMLAGAIVAVVIVLGIGLLVIGGEDGNNNDNNTESALSVEDQQATQAAVMAMATTDAALTQEAQITPATPNAALTSIAQTLDAQDAAIQNATVTIDQQSTRIAELETQAAASAAPSEAPSATPTTTAEPTSTPSAAPSEEPTQASTDEPTATPSAEPTDEPSPTPTTAPTEVADDPDTDPAAAPDFDLGDIDPDAPLPVPDAVPVLSGAFAALDRLDEEWLEGNGEIALQRLNVQIADAPDNATAYVVRSMYHNMLFNTENALADAERAVELAPNNVYSYLALADAHNHDNNIEAEAAALQTALELDPANPEVLWRMGRVAGAYGDERNLARYVRAAIRSGGQGFRFAQAVGDYFENSGEYELAIPYLETAVEGYPFDEWLFFELVRAYVVEDRAADAHAMAQARRADRELEPFTAANYAYIAYAAEDYETAESLAKSAEERQEVPILTTDYVLALTYWAQGSPEAASRFAALLSRDSTQEGPFVTLALGHDARWDYAQFLLDQGEPEAALEQLDNMLADDLSWFVPAHQLRGDVLLSLADTDGAAEAYLRGFDLLSPTPDTRAERDALRQRLVNLYFDEDAVEVALPPTAYPFTPADSELNFFSGLSDIQDDVDELAMLDRSPEDAVAYLSEIFAENPDDSEALAAYALLLLEFDGNADAALERVERLEELDPDNLVTFVARWHHSNHWSVNDPDTAEDALNTALELYPEHPALLWRMAMTQFELQNYNNAEEYVELSLQHPDSGFRYAPFLGDNALQRKEYERARDAFIIATLAYRDDAYLAEQLLHSLIQLENNDALTATVLALQPTADNSVGLYSSLAYAAWRADNPELALRLAQSAVALTRGEAAALHTLGLVVGDGLGDYENGLIWLDAATDAEATGNYFVNTEFGHLLPYDIARFMAALGRPDDALGVLQAVLVEYDWFVPNYLLAGELYETLGEPEAARESYTTGLEYAAEDTPEHAELQQRLATLATAPTEDAE